MSMTSKLHPAPRFVKFAVVGSSCFLVQITILKLLTASTGIAPAFANGIGFASSAQLNFAFSYRYTWRDARRLVRRRDFIKPWSSFNTAVLLALVVNMAVFAVAINFFGQIPSAMIALACGTVLNFTFNHFLTFRSHHPSTTQPM